MDIYNHIRNVDDILKDVRYYATGQNVQFDSVLPPHIRNMGTEEKATHIASQLTFSLAAGAPSLGAEALEECQIWFHDIAFYLFDECNPDDQIFKNIHRLFSLEYETRQIMFENKLPTSSPLMCVRAFPAAFRFYEVAVLHLLDCCGLQWTLRAYTKILNEAKAAMESQTKQLFLS